MSLILPFPSFLLGLGTEKHNLSSDTLKARLLNVAIDTAWDTWSDCSAYEIANGNGYTTGGVSLTVTSWSITDGAVRLIIPSPTWTSSGSGMASYQSLVVVNDTAPSDELCLYVDYGFGRSVAVGEEAPIYFDEENGIFLLGVASS
jgi:hypothetical protein